VIDDAELLRSVRDLGTRFCDGVEAIDAIGEVRGRGLMVGARLDGIDARQAAARALDGGLIVNPIGEEVLRFLPPLVIGEAEVDRALEILRDALG
jgi:acetylornithine/succinyldiaminopimelate/putrescine aminotransferase